MKVVATQNQVPQFACLGTVVGKRLFYIESLCAWFYLTFHNTFVSLHKMKYIGVIMFVCSLGTIGQVLMKPGVKGSL